MINQLFKSKWFSDLENCKYFNEIKDDDTYKCLKSHFKEVTLTDLKSLQTRTCADEVFVLTCNDIIYWVDANDFKRYNK